MVKIITISKAGKISLPKEVRKEIGLTGEERYVLVADEGNIILKRIGKSRSQQRIKELMDEFAEAFKKAKITKRDVEKAIREVRAEKYGKAQDSC